MCPIGFDHSEPLRVLDVTRREPNARSKFAFPRCTSPAGTTRISRAALMAFRALLRGRGGQTPFPHASTSILSARALATYSMGANRIGRRRTSAAEALLDTDAIFCSAGFNHWLKDSGEIFQRTTHPPIFVLGEENSWRQARRPGLRRRTTRSICTARGAGANFTGKGDGALCMTPPTGDEPCDIFCV